jgi:hypothetical protein
MGPATTPRLENEGDWAWCHSLRISGFGLQESRMDAVDSTEAITFRQRQTTYACTNTQGVFTAVAASVAPRTAARSGISARPLFLEACATQTETPSSRRERCSGGA